MRGKPSYGTMESWSALVRTKLAINTMPDAWHLLLSTSTRVNASRAASASAFEYVFLSERRDRINQRRSHFLAFAKSLRRRLSGIVHKPALYFPVKKAQGRMTLGLPLRV